MTRITFLHGAADRLRAASGWIAQQWQQGHRVVVAFDQADDRERLDSHLWSQPSTGFIPHCRQEDPLAAETPVTLALTLDQAPDQALLLNLGRAVPEGFGRFEELVEIVSTDEEERQQGRERYRFYRDRGYQISSTDIGNPTAP